MAHVITQSCCSDAGCVSVCPVNCIHPTPEERGFGTSEILHIDPIACIDCGACADACPVDAIFPADRLGARDSVFIEVNAAYYRDRPDVSSGRPDIVYPDIPRLPAGLRVAVVGTGPSGGYAVRTLVGRTDAHITVLDRLPTPGGLVRAGVAPDHPGTKGVLRTFDLLYKHRRVQLFGGVEVGGGDVGGGEAITPAELAEHFDAVFYAVGAPDSRALGVDGEDLPGSTSATDLVAWYNAAPGAAGPPIPEDGCGRAVIVGTGNVALDVARILVSSPESLAATDIADRALDLLRRQDIREVVILGRRGPEEAAYTSAEFRALAGLPDVEVVVADGDDLSGLHGAVDPDRRRIVFRFQTVVDRIRAGAHGRVEAVDVTTGGTAHTLAADLLVRSIGYRGVPIAGLPFDERTGVIPSVDGRVRTGVYAVGWAARGATGGIGANKAHAITAVESFIDDAASGRLARTAREPDDFRALVEARSPMLVGYRGVRAIDRAERSRGAAQGRPRIKFTDLSEMLAVARRRR